MEPPVSNYDVGPTFRNHGTLAYLLEITMWTPPYKLQHGTYFFLKIVVLCPTFKKNTTWKPPFTNYNLGPTFINHNVGPTNTK